MTKLPYMTDRPRNPHAQEVLESPIFVAVRKASGIEVAWVRVETPHSHTVLGYEPVRPDELELMDAGQYEPRDKDIGLYALPGDKKADVVRVGELMLMKITAERRAARVARENERALGLRPRITDKKGAEVATETEVETTLGAEIAAIQSARTT